MSSEILQQMVGSWQGTCRTWFEPDKLADESEIKGQIAKAFSDNFVRHTYESQMRGKPRIGEELVAFNSVTKRFQVSWADEFHMNYAILFSEGDSSESGFVVSGKYDGHQVQP